MTPDQDLRIDSLISNLALLVADRQKEQVQKDALDARLERIERALKVPLVYSLKDACARLGFSSGWGRKHPERLPAPINFKPLRFRVSDIEALALHGLPTMGRKGPRARRVKQAS